MTTNAIAQHPRSSVRDLWPRSQKTRVAIAGGGIGGLATAVALRRAGIGAEIFEQTPELREVGAGIQLGPNVVRLLGRLGLGERLREVAVRPEVVWEYRRWEDGRVLFQQSFGDEHRSVFGAPYYVVHRADLLHVLSQAVPDDIVHLNRRCVGVTQDRGGGVELAFEDGSGAGADVLVGADGIRSTVRDAVVPPEPARFSGLCCYRGLVPIERAPSLARRPVVTLWVGPGRHFVHYPVSAGRLVNFVAVMPAGDWRTESWTAPGRVEDAVAEYEGWHEQVRQLIGAADETKRWALYDREPLERWTAGRVALLGDAAHPMLQFFAQGAAQAIEDAVVLAGCLREAQSDSIEAALRRYEAIRKPRASKVQRLSRTRGEPWPRGDGWHLPDGEEQRQRDARFVQADPLRSNTWLYAHDVERELTESVEGGRHSQIAPLLTTA